LEILRNPSKVAAEKGLDSVRLQSENGERMSFPALGRYLVLEKSHLSGCLHKVDGLT
jgi:hypothetical protein